MSGAMRDHLARQITAGLDGLRVGNAGTVKLSRICPFCGRILLDQRLIINDLAVAAGGENAAKLLNLTVPARIPCERLSLGCPRHLHRSAPLRQSRPEASMRRFPAAHSCVGGVSRIGVDEYPSVSFQGNGQLEREVAPGFPHGL